MSKAIITDVRKLVREYEAGMSSGQLAIKYGTNRCAICSWLNKGGAKIRGGSERAKLRLATFGHPSLGRKHTPEAKEKMRKSHASMKGKNHPRYRGKGKCAKDGTYLTADGRGYLRRISKGHPLADKRGLIGEHVYQACLAFGIEKVRGMEIHHIDGNKQNNRPNNLLILTKSQHRKLENNLKK